MARRLASQLAACAMSLALSSSCAAGAAAGKTEGLEGASRPLIMRHEDRGSGASFVDSRRQPGTTEQLVAVSHTGRVGTSHLAPLGEVPVDASQKAYAQALVNATASGGLVSYSRKVATVELALKALELQGDFVETGVYNGGTAILMGKVLLPHAADQGKGVRNLWLADSFHGLPADHEPASAAKANKSSSGDSMSGLTSTSKRIGSASDYASSRQIFDNNLRAFGMYGNPHIKVLQGWFKDTLPTAPISSIAFLRLDGDIFASTMDAITSLYNKVAPNGYIYVDDYGSYKGCKDAIDSFRKSHSIQEIMYPIDEHTGHFEAVWWRKGS